MYDVGMCETHNRIREGLCKNCEIMICATCVMFGDHKKHDVISLKEGVAYLRDSIANGLKKGILRKDFTESHVLEIREYHLKLEKFKNDTIKRIDDIFKNLISTLKERKNFILNDLSEKFNEEKQRVLKDENKWVEKQEISEKLQSLLTEKEETILLQNSLMIMNGIRKLNEQISFVELKVYNDIDTSMTVTKFKGISNIHIELKFEDVVNVLSNYLSILEPNTLEFKS